MIINTRPISLSQNIITLCQDKQINLINAHLSEINQIMPEDIVDDWELKLTNFHTYENLIFTSQSSVKYGLELLQSRIDTNKMNKNVLSVGLATKKILSNKNISSISPENQSSEGILDILNSNYSGKSLLFCGKNSNNNLQNTLKERIDEIVCYELIFNKDQLNKIPNGSAIVLIFNFLTLKFILDNFNYKFITNKVFIVASKKIKDRAVKNIKAIKDLGIEIVVSEQPSDESMLQVAKKFT
jgi:uroporphyrinogen-III synthase